MGNVVSDTLTLKKKVSRQNMTMARLVSSAMIITELCKQFLPVLETHKCNGL